MRDSGGQVTLAAALLRRMYELSYHFASEWDQLFTDYSRLVPALENHHALGVGPPRGDLRELETWIARVQFPIPTNYPCPPKPTDAELAEFRRREEISDQVQQQCYRHWPLDRGEPAQDQAFIELLDWLYRWASVPLHKRRRQSRSRQSNRPVVRRYFDDIRRFVQRWNVEAWWSVPAVLQSHLVESQVGRCGPLPFHVSAAETIHSYPITIPLPGASDADFQRDQDRYRDLHLNRPLEEEGFPDLNYRWRPSRDEMAQIERLLGASCVTIDREPWTEDNPTVRILAAVEDRLGRYLTKRERHRLRGLVDLRVREIRASLLRTGAWHPRSVADRELHVTWLARKLLEPSLTWSDIAAREAAMGSGDYNRQVVGREARTLAVKLELALPR